MSASTVDPDARFITPPTDLPLAIICVSCVLLGLSVAAVALRSFSRFRDGVFGLDDGLIAAGTVIYFADVILGVYACLAGLGYKDEHLNNWQATQSMKFYVMWILVYVAALALVKSSICVSIQRIASSKKSIRITVWVLLFIVWASFFVTFIGTLLYCHPVEAIWNPSLILSGKGYCAPVDTFIALGQVATATTIVTDLGLVVLPALMLWKTQMKTQAKIQAFFLLSFASVASIITIVRIPYINHFRSPNNLGYWVAHILLYSNIETGIGCIAASIPSIRRLFPKFTGGGKAESAPASSNSIWTFGSRPPADKRFRNPTDAGFSMATVHSRANKKTWEELQDTDSDQGLVESEARPGIRAHTSYTVEVERSQGKFSR